MLAALCITLTSPSGTEAQETQSPTTQAGTQPADTTRDGLEAWRARPAMLTPRLFATLWTEPASRFRARWDSAFAADAAALRTLGRGARATLVQRERTRLRMRYVWGRTVWPYFHWREGDAAAVVPDPALPALVRALPLEDPAVFALPEHRELVQALVHERARTLMAKTPAYRRGDAQWLRAEFAATLAQFRSPALRRAITTHLLLTHLDDNDERGVDSVHARWLALRPAATDIARVDSLVRVARRQRTGHQVVTYQHIDGVPLELHVLRPTGGDTTGLRPAMLWLHGGSFTTGSWAHSPGVVRRLRENGVTVIAVEFRTGARFDATPVGQYEDALRAFAHVRQHAAALGVDASRIGVSGFSSGATTALILATRGLEATRPTPSRAERRYPDAIIVTGACTDPAGPGEDGWFRRTVSRVAPPTDYSPMHLLSAGQPRMLLVHGARDEYCGHADARRFVERAQALGVDATLETVDDATHFFGFYHRPGQEQMRRAIERALTAWGWHTPGGTRPE